MGNPYGAYIPAHMDPIWDLYTHVVWDLCQFHTDPIGQVIWWVAWGWPWPGPCGHVCTNFTLIPWWVAWGWCWPGPCGHICTSFSLIPLARLSLLSGLRMTLTRALWSLAMVPSTSKSASLSRQAHYHEVQTPGQEQVDEDFNCGPSCGSVINLSAFF